MLPGSIARRDPDRGPTDAGTAARYAQRGMDLDYVNSGARDAFNAGMLDRSAVDQLFLGVPPATTNSSSSSSRRRSGGGGGGGGGGYAAPSPQVQAAYKALWESQMGKAMDLGAGYDKYEAGLRKAYDPSRVNAIYDTAKTGVQDASKAGQERLAPIFQGLNDRAAQGRTAVSDAYGQGDARLADLESQYLGRLAAADNGTNAVLSAFDAGSVAPSGEQNLLNLMANSRFANARMGTIADAGLADRPAMYEGLNADVQSGMARDEAGLMNQIAMKRAASGAQADSSLQMALAQAALQRMTAEQARQQQQDQLRIELAQMGMTPPSTFTGSW
jgi:hypothetical protein